MEFNFIFDIIGTIAFAVSGALVGISRKMDIFGIITLGLATAIGGGILRDLLVNITPPTSLVNPLSPSIAIISCITLFLIYRHKLSHKVRINWIRPTYVLADNLGLASFTVTGATVGFTTHPENGMLVVVLGLLTAVGGGVIRDILAQKIPSVLIEDVYASPSLVGGIVFYPIALYLNLNLATIIAFATVFLIRTISLYNHWSLPRLNMEDNYHRKN